MLLDGFGDLNWLAVIVAAALYYILGALWFLPQTLGKAWAASMGIDLEANPPRMNPIAFVVPAVAYIVTAVVTGLLVSALAYTEPVDGIVLGLAVGLGYAVSVTFVTANYEPQKPHPWTWFAITGAYYLVGIVLVALVLTLWQ